MNSQRWWPCELRGRSGELGLIENELRRVADGGGTAVMVTGGAGIGKTRLLAETKAVADRLGIRTGSVTAEPNESAVEMSTLLSALFDGREPLLSRKELPPAQPQPTERFWLLRDIEALLEKSALRSPLAVCVDDAHWVDAGTAAALRELPLRLRDVPIAWIIAARPAPEATPIARTLDYLGSRDLCKVGLGPLGNDAVTAITGEILGAEPGRNVLTLAEQADGNPFLLVETLLGLREEERVEIADGLADVRDIHLPRRVAHKMRERLALLSTPARDTVIVAASLGRRFSFTDMARMLDRPTSDLLAPVGELLDADLFIERDASLAFWHDITREAVRASVPLSARCALDRQAATVLLERGALPVEVAHQLAASAEPADEVAITTLLQAAKAIVSTDAATAADFGRRALDLAPSQHPQRGEIVSVTAVALHTSGNSGEAIGFADAALRDTLPAEQEAQVRLSIAGMFAISPDARAEACRRALSLPDVSLPLRAVHLACLAYNLLVAGRIEEARRSTHEARVAVAATCDPRASLVLGVAEAGIAYADERFDEAVELFTKTAREGLAAGENTRIRMVQMYCGEILTHLDREDEAFAIAREGLASAQRDRQDWIYAMYETWQARLWLRFGRISEAAAVLEGRFELEDGTNAVAALDGAGLCAMARAAMHMADTRQLRRAGEIGKVLLDLGTPVVKQHAAWTLALTAMGDGDMDAARDWLAGLADEPALPRFPQDVTDEMVLARIAAATGDTSLAQLALVNVRRRAAVNPGSLVIAATRAYVQGLLANDDRELRAGADGFERCRRPLEWAMATEDLGICLLTSDHEAGVAALGQVLARYTDLGAVWDARRVRGRLRDLGIRRRLVVREPATRGWAALTAAEESVAGLVAQGLTNREVAERLFLSPHTVNSHLRHVFSKLGIKSRVELARLGALDAGASAVPTSQS
ncbi:LuxR C-terminal-related transcriptional regulator [Streptomyces sp. NPDC086549]|uniref:LuxR C-terminal-related transcriptional regulator n=1 Tax=Streptomyces sp. NPDC086549 TaxID=3365752 RepID=UPI0038296C7A